MMQSYDGCDTSFNPSIAEVALDIDTKNNSVTLSGTKYSFSTPLEMESFLQTLWDAEVPRQTKA
ncbi:MAG: hypothetical protein V7739_08485 [Motiliproteus sp.]